DAGAGDQRDRRRGGLRPDARRRGRDRCARGHPARRRRPAQGPGASPAPRRTARRPARGLRAGRADRAGLGAARRGRAAGRCSRSGAVPAPMIRLAVRCEPEDAGQVMVSLLELAPNGLEEERGPGWVEFAIYGPPGEVPELGELRAAAGDSLVDVTTTSVPDDWADRWADFHRPIEVAGRIRVRPSW